ncbi:MAG TPA: alpha/beta fold hydrolase [Chitinophagaceae bacterium]|nr:alpha/beta fold hydrolase [Chitinophagaceae bacterium]
MKLGQKIAINYIRAKLNILALVSKEKAAAKAFDLFCTPFRKPRKKKPSIFDKGEKLHFKLEGIDITGHRWNHPQERKVLIVHGFESTSYNFDRYIGPLVKKGYEVLAFDAPAHGNSGGKRITLPLYVEMLKKICELYGPIHSYMAHSFGGLALAHFLESYEHDEQTKVALLAPATETVTAIDSFFKFLHLNNELRKEFDELIFKKGNVPPEHYSIKRAVKNIKARLLWFHDEDDEMTPLKDALKVMDDNHAHIEFVISKGFGHRRLYRENKVVKRVIEFL